MLQLSTTQAKRQIRPFQQGLRLNALTHQRSWKHLFYSEETLLYRCREYDQHWEVEERQPIVTSPNTKLKLINQNTDQTALFDLCARSVVNEIWNFVNRKSWVRKTVANRKLKIVRVTWPEVIRNDPIFIYLCYFKIKLNRHVFLPVRHLQNQTLRVSRRSKKLYIWKIYLSPCMVLQEKACIFWISIKFPTFHQIFSLHINLRCSRNGSEKSLLKLNINRKSFHLWIIRG